MEDVICHYCHKQIRDQDELITASNKFQIRPFHYLCYEEIEEEANSQWKLWKPVNGITGNITAALMGLLALWMLFTDTLQGIGDLIGVLATYPVLQRMVSYFKYEKKLPKFIEDKNDSPGDR